MKTWITVLCAVAVFAGCAGKKDAGVDAPDVVDAPKPAVEAPKVVVDRDQIEYRDGLFYFEGKPFTGVAVAKYDNGQKKEERTFKDGKPDGLWTSWYENGQKRVESTWKADKAHGLQTFWYDNGQKSLEVTFKNGKEHGLYTQWHKNGQKREERTFKDGKFISIKKWDKDGNPR